jgi:hypothetical protein
MIFELLRLHYIVYIRTFVMSLNTKLQQDLEYEKYVQKIIKNKYINCWLWCEVPKHVLVDLKIIHHL